MYAPRESSTLCTLQAYERCKQEVDNRAQRERQTLAIAKAVLSDPDARAAIISQQRSALQARA